MIRTLLKWALLAAVVYGGYKGAQIYAVMQLGAHMQACQFKDQLCPLVLQRADGKTLTAALKNAMTCVADRQSVLESVLFSMRIPETLKPIVDEDIDDAQLATLCRP